MCTVLCEEQDTGERRISISTEIEDGVTVAGDQLLLSRVIVNLLDNARKVRKRKPATFSCACIRKRNLRSWEVEDDGIGIEKDRLEKIWQRFYQADGSRGTGSGLGLGLSMVQQIVRLHGGELSVESTAGAGSLFTVCLNLDMTDGKES